MTGDAIFWLSEVGVIKWDSSGIQNISKNIINIPLDKSYIGLYVPTRHQYWLHDNVNKKTFVYDILRQAWFTFTGLDIVKSRTMEQGDELVNSNIFLTTSDTMNEYPQTAGDFAVDTVITTKKYPVERNVIFRRYRMDYVAQGTLEVDTDIENYDSSAPTSTVAPAGRMQWAGLANGSWGENVQLEITNADKLQKIEIDLHERS
jgi:hypothetical protein